CRQRNPTRQGEYPHAELQGASNRPTRSSMHLSEAISQTAAEIPWLVIIRHVRVQRNLLIVGCGVASGQPLTERPSCEAEQMAAPDQCCSNVRKFLPRHASTPLPPRTCSAATG